MSSLVLYCRYNMGRYLFCCHFHFLKIFITHMCLIFFKDDMDFMETNKDKVFSRVKKLKNQLINFQGFYWRESVRLIKAI